MASEDPARPLRDDVRYFVERLSLLLAGMGLPPMPARVWAGLMVADGPSSTAGELAERLDVSPAAISGALRYLQQVQLIERVAVPGSRRQHVRTVTDLWYQTFLNRQAGLEAFAALAEEGAELLGPSSPGCRRVLEIRDFFAYLAEEMPLIYERWMERVELLRRDDVDGSPDQVRRRDIAAAPSPPEVRINRAP